MSERDRMVSRVRKLMRVANDDGASQGEIANALRMAQDVMRRYNIEHAELKHEEITTRRSVSAKRFQSWEWLLAELIGRVCNTVAIRHRKGALCSAEFVGHASDAHVASLLFPDVRRSIRSMARSVCGTRWSTAHRCYAMGFVAGLDSRVTEWRGDTAQENAIVLDRTRAVNEWLDEGGAQPFNLRVGKLRDTEALAKGHKQGREFVLKQRLHDSHKPQLTADGGAA